MVLFVLALPAAFAVGFAAGVLLTHWELRHAEDLLPAPAPDAPIGDWVAAEIMEAARQYAEDVGRPEIADLVARKLLSAHRVGLRRRGQ